MGESIYEWLGVTDDRLQLCMSFRRAKCRSAVVPVNGFCYVCVKHSSAEHEAPSNHKHGVWITGCLGVLLKMTFDPPVLFLRIDRAKKELRR